VIMNVIMKLAASGMPFVLRVWIVFLACLVVGVIVSMLTAAPREEQTVDLGGISFATTKGFKITSAVIVLILIGIYAVFW